jgi:hypothetical protein
MNEYQEGKKLKRFFFLIVLPILLALAYYQVYFYQDYYHAFLIVFLLILQMTSLLLFFRQYKENKLKKIYLTVFSYWHFIIYFVMLVVLYKMNLFSKES